MKLIGKAWLTKNKQGEWWTNLRGECEQIKDPSEIASLVQLKRIFGSKYSNDEQKRQAFNLVKAKLINSVENPSQEIMDEQKRLKLTNVLNDMIRFFSEFNFTPNYRFINTFAHHYSVFANDAKSYIANYFALTDNSYKSVINDKMQSQEFQNILAGFINVFPSKRINNRFKIYYGSQGTGKTTLAMQETDNNCMVCHNAMLPQDLMEDFDFVDGKPVYRPSALQVAIVEGKQIVLDEINLLPFESLRFLQSILDGKKVFTYKGQLIEIKDGFQIIGTMNLEVNGMTYALPEPLVDRACELREFKLSGEQLVEALI